MVKGKISRVGELRSFLNDFSDDSFVYMSISEFGAALCAVTDVSDGSDEKSHFEMSSKEIYVPSMTNELVQDQIKKMEKFFN